MRNFSTTSEAMRLYISLFYITQIAIFKLNRKLYTLIHAYRLIEFCNYKNATCDILKTHLRNVEIAGIKYK